MRQRTMTSQAAVPVVKGLSVRLKPYLRPFSAVIAISLAAAVWAAPSDTDGDGIPDGWEMSRGLNPFDGTDGQYDPDTDNLDNLSEYQYDTDPQDPDTDRDGVPDGGDVLPLDPLYALDSDGDGLPDRYEERYFFLDPFFPADALDDFDGDMASNLVELQRRTDPENPDSDNDGVWDNDDPSPNDARYSNDSDLDQLPDRYEQQYFFLDPFNSADADDTLNGDSDGFSPLEEFLLGTAPDLTDTDNDGVDDSQDIEPLLSRYSQDQDGDGMPMRWEWTEGLDDNNAVDGSMDNDGDGLASWREYVAGTRASLPDSDFDTVLDGQDFWPTDGHHALDEDFDGLPSGWEMAHGFDPFQPMDAGEDRDGDGWSTLREYQTGTNPSRMDSDGDGEPDSNDFAPLDANYRLDSDGDGIPDGWELGYQLDPNFPGDAQDDFPDGDGLNNLEEYRTGTDPANQDSDGDGRFDRDDPWPTDSNFQQDSDSDGLPDAYELANQLDPYNPQDAHDPFLGDGDELTAFNEFLAGTNPLQPDTDNDGLWDPHDLYPLDFRYSADYDRDGMPDEWEMQYGFNTGFASDGYDDGDGDLLTNLQEFEAGTDPLNPDTDVDGVNDGEDPWPTDSSKRRDDDLDGMDDAWEEAYGLSPWDPQDAVYDWDGDGLTNIEEYRAGTDPMFHDSDRDGVMDGDDVAPLNPAYRHDTDGDGLPDAYEDQYPFLDSQFPHDATDSYLGDPDMLSPLEEFRLGTDPENPDTDGDGIPDHDDTDPTNPAYQSDRDGDGLPDAYEDHYPFLNADDPRDALDTHIGDPDMLSPLVEFQRGTDPSLHDTDGDGQWDNHDLYPLDPRYTRDTDGDGMPYEWEMMFGLQIGIRDGGDDPDTDMLSNYREFQAETDPQNPDTDVDGVYDGEDPWPTDSSKRRDDDFDGMDDAWEEAYGLSPWDPYDAVFDWDGDGFNNLEEYNAGTDPMFHDSDRDGVMDGDDIAPLDSAYRHDSDGDGLPDAYEDRYPFLDPQFPHDATDSYLGDPDMLSPLEEFRLGADPENPDTDGDGLPDNEDIDPTNPAYQSDRDGDGLPDAYEDQYPFLNADDPLDALDTHRGDPDMLSPLVEFQRGTDPENPDTDGDGPWDNQDLYPLDPRYTHDTDGDGLPYEWEMRYGLQVGFRDGGDDPDMDMLSNYREFLLQTHPQQSDTDFDGVLDGDDIWPLDRTKAADNDHDGMPDGWEEANGFYPWDPQDPQLDWDGDGLNNLAEFLAGTDPRHPDTDRDDMLDGEDVEPLNDLYALDSDGDQLPDAWEFAHNLIFTDPTDADFDKEGDGLTNAEEYALGTDPQSHDSDVDGVPDDTDVAPANPAYRDDTDGDGLPDGYEWQFGFLDPFQAQDAVDPNLGDWDELSPLAEYRLGTNPELADTDNDGMPDNSDAYPLDPAWQADRDRDGMPDEWEMQYGFNTTMALDGSGDPDGDQYTNLQEFRYGTDPLQSDADSDGDGVRDHDDAFPFDPSETVDSDNDGIGDNADADDDNDQLPDDWEIQYNLDPLSATDAAADPDADEYVNLEEFQLGTDPTDIADPGNPFVRTAVISGVDNSAWTTVTLDRAYRSMVVIATPRYDYPSPPMVVRVRNAVDDRFELRVERADGLDESVLADVHYVVVEEGVYNATQHGITMEAVKLTSTVTDRQASWAGEARGYLNSYTNPVVLGQVMSAHDANWSVFWARGNSRNAPPTASTLYVGKHVGEDPNWARADEVIGYVVIDAGSGAVKGWNYTAALGVDTIKGTQNGSYTYTLSGVTSPVSAIVTQAAMDGNNGGWTVLTGDVTAGGIELSIEEDQLKDNERSHTTEQAGYLILERAL